MRLPADNPFVGRSQRNRRPPPSWRGGVARALRGLASALGHVRGATGAGILAAATLAMVAAPLAAQLVDAEPAPVSPFLRVRSFGALVLLAGLAWAVGHRRRTIPWRVVLWGLGLQIAFAVLVLETRVGVALFATVDHALHAVLGFTVEGARFIFGDLVFNNVPVGEGIAGTNDPIVTTPRAVARTGAFFAFNVLPTIIFVSSLMTVLYHVGVMERVVKGLAWIMQRTMRTSAAETLATAANIFVGLMEAPLVVKPYIERMTASELMLVMTAGFATISGGVLAAYVGMLSTSFPGIAGHLIAASVMSAPAAIVVAKLMLPEEEEPETLTLAVDVERPDVNVIDAAARGASDGLRLALEVGAMLIAFLALLAMLNALVGWVGGLAGLDGLSLEALLGIALAPVAWLIGVPWSEAFTVGELIGLKTVLNEFVAYLRLAELLERGAPLSSRSVVLASYALAGFANFGSIAMTIAGLGEIAPSRRHDLARLGLRAMIGGGIAALMTAAVAGMLV